MTSKMNNSTENSSKIKEMPLKYKTKIGFILYGKSFEKINNKELCCLKIDTQEKLEKCRLIKKRLNDNTKQNISNWNSVNDAPLSSWASLLGTSFTISIAVPILFPPEQFYYETLQFFGSVLVSFYVNGVIEFCFRGYSRLFFLPYKIYNNHNIKKLDKKLAILSEIEKQRQK